MNAQNGDMQTDRYERIEKYPCRTLQESVMKISFANISMKTIWLCLRRNGSSPCILNICIKQNTIRAVNRENYVQWCTGKRKWTVKNEWKKVVFLTSARLPLWTTVEYIYGGDVMNLECRTVFPTETGKRFGGELRSMALILVLE